MTFPTLPDNIHKFLLIIGLFLCVYSYFEYQKAYENYNIRIEKYQELANNTENLILKNIYALEKMEKKAVFLSKKHNVDNPISSNDSIITFHQTIVGSKKEEEVSKTINELWNSYNDEKFNLKIEKKKLKRFKKKLNFNEKELSEKVTFHTVLFIIGLLLLSSGYDRWKKEQNIKEKLINWEILKKGKIYPHCQNCGKNFSINRLYGTNKDKTVNYSFCIDCYNKGKFKKILTKKDFEELKRNVIKEQKGWLSKKIIKNRFENLERWNEDEYS